MKKNIIDITVNDVDFDDFDSIPKGWPPRYLPSLTKLARLVDMPLSTLRGWRDSCPRFPRKTAKGYCLHSFLNWRELRELEAMTDEGFTLEEIERREEMKADPKLRTMLTSDELKTLFAEPLRTRAEAIEECVENIERWSDV